MIFLCSTLAFAGDNESNEEGSITLVDSSGVGPGVRNIQVARRSVVAYDGTGNAAGYGGTSGQVMCVVAGSGAANPDDAIYVGVRGSQMRDQIFYPDDNMTYQDATMGQQCTVDECVVRVTTDITTWHIRGGGEAGS
jgi:hypothetical protein